MNRSLFGPSWGICLIRTKFGSSIRIATLNVLATSESYMSKRSALAFGGPAAGDGGDRVLRAGGQFARLPAGLRVLLPRGRAAAGAAAGRSGEALRPGGAQGPRAAAAEPAGPHLDQGGGVGRFRRGRRWGKLKPGIGPSMPLTSAAHFGVALFLPTTAR